MGTKKKDKEFLWLQVIHLLEDVDLKYPSSLHKKLKELNSKFFIKERERKPTQEQQ